MKKYTGLLCTLLFLQVAVYGNHRISTFSGYSISEGLSQSVVNCVFQDSKGTIWLGTQNGLNCFDGYAFEVHTFSPDDPNSISNNWIFAIAEDPQGNLWIGTKGGLNKYLTKEKRFERVLYQTPFEPDITRYIYDVKCTQSGQILINTPPILSICDPLTMNFNHYPAALAYDGSVKDCSIPLLEDDNGMIWVGSTRGLACFRPDTQRFDTLITRFQGAATVPNENITALWQDLSGHLWIGTTEGLYRINILRGQDGTDIAESCRSLPVIRGFVRAISGDKDGNIWVATEGAGLYCIRMDDGNGPSYVVFHTGNSGLFHDIVLSLMVDRSENLWIGTLSGVNKADLKDQKFRLYRNSNAPFAVDLAGNVIASLHKDKNGRVWVGTWGQGISIVDRESGQVDHYASDKPGRSFIPNDFVHVLFEDSSGYMWAGTRDGLLVFNPMSRQFIRPHAYSNNPGLPDLQGLRIFAMVQSGRGDFWLATQDGLFCKLHGSQEIRRYHADAQEPFQTGSNLVYDVIEDHDGFIWVATSNGLDVFGPEGTRTRHFSRTEGNSNSLSDNYVTALCEDWQGDIWIGTSSYVSRFSKKDSSFVYYSNHHGLPGNLIYSILEDKDHMLWFATGNGLCRYDPSSGVFRTYTVDDGLQSPEFNLGAAFLAQDGEMFFGGMNGFNSFYPDSLADNPYLPPIIISRVYKFEKGMKEFLNPDDEGRLVLGHRESTLTVEFAALEFTNPSRNLYKYRIGGVDDEWTDIGHRNFVAFTNLSPGDYRLSVMGSNNDGVWSKEVATLHIIIRPPWWSSHMAYVMYVLITIILVLYIIRERERAYARHRTILEERVRARTALIEKQKAEIVEKNQELKELNASKDKFFSIIAHDLRNPFNYIIGMTDMLLMDIKGNGNSGIRHQLGNIRGSAEQAHELLENLLLWARSHTGNITYHPAPVDMRRLIDQSISLISGQAGRKGIAIQTTGLQKLMVSVDQNMISTVLRNLLTNALKFTRQGGSISVGLTTRDGHCVISVKDNGIGMPQEKLSRLFGIDSSHKTKGTNQEPGTGLGLIICKELTERHGGRIHVESIEQEGSEFSVVLPLIPA